MRAVLLALLVSCSHPAPPVVTLPDPLASLPRCLSADPHPLPGSCGDLRLNGCGPFCVVCADRACLDDHAYVWCVTDLCEDGGRCK